MKRQVKKKPPEPKVKARLRPNIAWHRNNYVLLAIGVIVIIAGFIFLASGSITLAPILLVAGYCIIIPLAILLKFGSAAAPKKEDAQPQPTPPKSGQ